MQLQTCGGMQYSEPDSTLETVVKVFPFYMILKAILDLGQFGVIQTLMPEQVPQILEDADHHTSPCFTVNKQSSLLPMICWCYQYPIELSLTQWDFLSELVPYTPIYFSIDCFAYKIDDNIDCSAYKIDDYIPLVVHGHK